LSAVAARRRFRAADVTDPTLFARAGEEPSLRAEPGRLQAVRDRDASVLVRPAAVAVAPQLGRADARPSQVPVRGAVRHRRLERRQPDRDHGDVRHQVRLLDAHSQGGHARAARVPRHDRHEPVHLRDRRVRRVGVFQFLSEVQHGHENVGRSGADEL